MKLHGNAALSLNQRRRLARRVVEEGWSLAEAARAAEVSERTARKWVDRYRGEGVGGLVDRPSTPGRVHDRTSEDRVRVIAALRRLRFTGPEIAELLEMATSTVSAVLKRIGLGKLSRLKPPEPVRRYERRRPGELLHIDVKKLGRISVKGAGHRVTGNKRSKARRRDRGPSRGVTGWEFVHVCVDDATRLAYAEVLANERATTAVAFLRRVLAFYRAHGVEVERVMTDNGSAYVSAVFALACRGLGIKHCRTRPYRPQTNGKAERFIRTMLTEWAYAAVYGSPIERTTALSGWVERYNTTRRHGALGHRPPIARLKELQGNNVAGTYT
jgi:transposase InsO family protein/transposase-like protein